MKRSEIPGGITTETGHETRLWLVLVHYDDQTAAHGPYEMRTWAEAYAKELSQEAGDVPTSVMPLFTPHNRLVEVLRYSKDFPVHFQPGVARDIAEAEGATNDALNVTVQVGDFGWCEDGQYENDEVIDEA